MRKADALAAWRRLTAGQNPLPAILDWAAVADGVALPVEV